MLQHPNKCLRSNSLKVKKDLTLTRADNVQQPADHQGGLRGRIQHDYGLEACIPLGAPNTVSLDTTRTGSSFPGRSRSSTAASWCPGRVAIFIEKTKDGLKTLDGIFSEQVAMGYSHSLVIAREEGETEKEKLRELPEYNPQTL